MHHKSRQSRDFTSEILCLRIKELNSVSQIFKLSRKEVLPLTRQHIDRSQMCKKPPQFRASMRKTISCLCFGYMQLSHVLLVPT